MADAADEANNITELERERSIARARRPMLAGVAGECNDCGEDMPRLVFGRCAPCRDGRRLAL